MTIHVFWVRILFSFGLSSFTLLVVDAQEPLVETPPLPTDPAGQDRKFIRKWLENDHTYKWERVQWWWLREGTPHRTLDETIELLQTRFTVGLTHRYRESKKVSALAFCKVLRRIDHFFPLLVSMRPF